MKSSRARVPYAACGPPRTICFARVDLYNVQGRVYFGELTCTPAAGLNAVTHEIRAAMRSRMWKLDFENPRLYHELGPWRHRLR